MERWAFGPERKQLFCTKGLSSSLKASGPSLLYVIAYSKACQVIGPPGDALMNDNRAAAF